MTDESSPTPSRFESMRQSLSGRRTSQTPVSSDVNEDDDVLPFSQRADAMKLLEASETRFGYALALLGLIFTIGLNVPYLFGPHRFITTAKPSSGHCPKDYVLHGANCELTTIYHPSDFYIPLLLGLVLTLGIAVLVRMSRRTPVVMTSVLLGLVLADQPPDKIFLLGAPFWVYGGWLMLRARRLQKFGTTNAKTVARLTAEMRTAKKVGGALPAEVASRSDVAASPKPPAKKGGATKRSAPQQSSSAEQSKRYTPKKQAPKKPAPPVEAPKPSRFRKLIGDEDPSAP